MDKNPRPGKIIGERDPVTKRRRVATVHEGASRTQQQFKDDCDVNKIMEKYRRTGTITFRKNVQDGVYMNLADAPDYQEALNTVIQAERAFEEVPSKIRLRFENDPKQFLAYLADPANHAEAVKLGLMTSKQIVKDPVLDTLNEIAKNTKNDKNGSTPEKA